MDLYPQSGGTEVDGVMMMDPYAIQALLAYTGPIQVDGRTEPLTATNAAQFLLVDQYLIPTTAQRADLLAQAAETTFTRLLAGSLPSPGRLAKDLGPLVAEGRIRFWSDRPAESEMLDRTHLSGRFPQTDGADGAALVVANAGANKLSGYLSRSVDRTTTFDAATGLTHDTYTVTLASDAPTSGLPDTVAGIPESGPRGTNRLYTCLYSPLELAKVTIDGQPSTMETGIELGWNVFCRYIDVRPQSSVTMTVELKGRLARPDAPFTRWVQPLVLPQTWTDGG
jgi:hypothetical protein